MKMFRKINIVSYTILLLLMLGGCIESLDLKGQPCMDDKDCTEQLLCLSNKCQKKNTTDAGLNSDKLGCFPKCSSSLFCCYAMGRYVCALDCGSIDFCLNDLQCKKGKCCSGECIEGNKCP